MHTKKDVYDFLAELQADNPLGLCDVRVDRDSVTLEFYHMTDSNLVASNQQYIKDTLYGFLDCKVTSLHELTIYGLDDGKPTAAMRELAKIVEKMRDYPVLDSDDYEEREHKEADEYCMTWYGDDMFKLWRAGELGPEQAEQWGHALDVPYPEPAAVVCDELPTEGPVYDWLYANAYARAREDL